MSGNGFKCPKRFGLSSVVLRNVKTFILITQHFESTTIFQLKHFKYWPNIIWLKKYTIQFKILSKWILWIILIKGNRDFCSFILITLPKASSVITLADAWVSFVCGLYKILEVPYRDRRLGEPLAGWRRPIRGPLCSRGMGLEEFYTAQRQKKYSFSKY